MSDTFDTVPVPQPREYLKTRTGRTEMIERVDAYYLRLNAWSVHVLTDAGHRADTKGNPITRIVRNAGFGSWQEIPDR